MTLQTFDRPAGRIRAVYGRTKGLVARRKALMAGATEQDGSSSESSSSESECNEKENQKPRPGRGEGSKVEKSAKRQMTARALPSAKCSMDSDLDDEVRPYQQRLNRPRARSNRVVVDSEDEIDDLVIRMGKTFRIAASAAVVAAAASLSPKKEKSKRGSAGDAYCELLTICDQDGPEDFSAFLSRMESKEGCKKWEKVGEASYSEVYGLSGSDSVVKIVPLQTEGDRSNNLLPEQSLLSDVLREVQVTKTLSKVASGFVQMRSAKVVQGRYPGRLLHSRTDFKARTDDPDSSPESFSSQQRYAALVLCHGGQDLESIEDLTWKQASSIFCQVVQALSLAEKTYQFEHRDLHWGNVVVAPVEMDAASPTRVLSADAMSDPDQSGVKATIIDYTLSRATFGSTLIAYPFDDETLFEGQGDKQFEIYRQMRAETGRDWSGYYPNTNVLWLDYLASKLIDEKKIPNPKRRSRLDHRGSDELESRNFLMQVKQLLSSKRLDSASALYSALPSLTF